MKVGDAAEAPNSPELGASRFQDISIAEKRLLEAMANGETVDYSQLPLADRAIRGEVLSWICTTVAAATKPTHLGVSIVGAEVHGPVNLKWARVSIPIQAINCKFSDAIILTRARIFYLALSDSSIKELAADGTLFESSLLLNGVESFFRAQNRVNLAGATRAGLSDLTGPKSRARASHSGTDSELREASIL